MILCVTTPSETAHLAKTLWLLGCVLGSIAYGILLVLAHWCLQALRGRKHGSTYVNKGLIIYVLLVVVITTAAEAISIKGTLYGVLDDTCAGPYLHVYQPYFGPPDIVNFLITLLTDGLFVWRCYIITSGLRVSPLLWIAPLFSYIMLLALIIALTIGLFMPLERQGFLAVLFPLHLGTSAFVNTLITSIIVALLFQHRHMLIQTFGKEQQLPILNIVTILTESAALVVFVDIAVIVTITSFNSVGDLVSQIWNFAQPIASLLIINRVSRDSDYFSQKKEEAQEISVVKFVDPVHPSV